MGCEKKKGLFALFYTIWNLFVDKKSEDKTAAFAEKEEITMKKDM